MKSFRLNIIILIFIAFYIIVFSPLEIPLLKNAPHPNNQNLRLPQNVTQEIDAIRSDNFSYFSRWEAHEMEHTVTIYLNCTQWPKKNNVTGMVIDNWAIQLTMDPEVDETYNNVTNNYIPQWSRSHQDQAIGYVDAHICIRKMYVTIFNVTPEIENSEVTVDGWQLVFVRAS